MRTTLVVTAVLVLACCGKPRRKPPPVVFDGGAAATAPLEQLPPGLRIEAAQVRLKTPIKVFERGAPVESSDVVELRLTSSEPIPARALDPVLLVGDRAVVHYRYEDPQTMVFTELEPAKLPDSAAIRFRWGDERGAAMETGQRFERKALKTIDR